MVLDNKQVSSDAILTTLLYSDIFHFPLSQDELWRFLLSKRTLSSTAFEEGLQAIRKRILYKEGFYCLRGRGEIIDKRIRQLGEQKKKLAIASAAAGYLCTIPSVLFIGISGGLALGDAGEEDDIDFFIITQRGRLWTSRILILVLLERMGIRRRKGEKHTANKICTNLLIEETALSWPSDKHDVYSAHEIVQMKPLFDRDNIYRRFIESNGWIGSYFPNFSLDLTERIIFKKHREYVSLNVLHRFMEMPLIDNFVKGFQEQTMKKHLTNETITSDFLALHPHDYRSEILVEFGKKLRRYGLEDFSALAT